MSRQVHMHARRHFKESNNTAVLHVQHEAGNTSSTGQKPLASSGGLTNDIRWRMRIGHGTIRLRVGATSWHGRDGHFWSAVSFSFGSALVAARVELRVDPLIVVEGSVGGSENDRDRVDVEAAVFLDQPLTVGVMYSQATPFHPVPTRGSCQAMATARRRGQKLPPQVSNATTCVSRLC